MKFAMGVLCFLIVAEPLTAFAGQCDQACSRTDPAQCKAQCKAKVEAKAKSKGQQTRESADCDMACEIQTKDCKKLCEAMMKNQGDPKAMQAESKAIIDRRQQQIKQDKQAGRRP